MLPLATPQLLEALGYALIALAVLQAGGGTWSVWRRGVAERRMTAAAAQRFGQIADHKLRRAKAKLDRALLTWNGTRKFEVARKIPECDGVHSFELRPHDGRPLAPFLPGQYLTFQIRRPGDDTPLVRCYSLSDSPNRADVYRITVKAVRPPPGSNAPPGRASAWFNDTVKQDDILDVKAPAGHFHLDPLSDAPIVMIAGGIGITPMMSMVRTLAAEAAFRIAWLFYGVRNRTEHVFADELTEVRREMPSLTVVTYYSRPTGRCVEGRDYDRVGRVTVEELRAVLPSNNFEFFLCGPAAMMETVTRDLAAWGVPKDKIHFEAFGAATVPRQDDGGRSFEVVFQRSNKTAMWTGGCRSLLDLAEANGVAIDSGCRAGNCGTCAVAITDGTADHLSPPGAPPAEGTCLSCIAAPTSRLVLDA